MLVATGNLWRYHRTHWIVVPTNVGWKLSDGCNIMGKGVALDARRRFPELPIWYADACKTRPRTMKMVLYMPGRLILLPTKRFNEKEPWLSWQSPSEFDYVESQVAYMAQQNDLAWNLNIAMPMVGCGCGGLDAAQVEKMIGRYCKDDRYVLVRQPE